MKIYQKLIIVFLALGLLFGFVGYMSLSKAKKALQEQIGKEASLLTDQIMIEIDEEIYHRIEEMQTYAADASLVNEASLSNEGFDRITDVQKYIKTIDGDWKDKKNTPVIRGILNNKLSQKLKKHLELYNQIYGYDVFGEMYVTNKYGAAIASTERLSDYLQADEKWYQEAIAEKDFWVDDLEYDESSDTFSIGIVINLYNEDGKFAGIFKGALSTEDIKYTMDLIHSRSQYKSMKPYLVDRNGITIFSGLDQGLKQAGRDIRLAEFGTDISLRKPVAQVIKGNNGYILNTEGGKKLLSVFSHSNGFRDFKGLGWSIIIDFETEEVFGPVFKLKNSLALAFLFTMIIATLVSIYIFRERMRAEKVLRQRILEMFSINTLFQQVSANLSLKQVVHTALKEIISAVTPDLALLFIREGDDNLLLQEHQSSNPKFHHKETPVHHIGECLCGLAVRDGKSIYCSDIRNDTRCTWEECKDAGLLSFAALPLMVGENILGVLGLASGRKKRDFSKQAAFLETLASGIAISLQNALLYEEVKQNETELDKSNKELMKHRENLKDLVTERTRELEEAQQELIRKERLAILGQLTATVNHEIRNPLGTVRNAVFSIGEAIKHNEMEHVDRSLKLAERNIKRCDRIINELMDFTRIRKIDLEMVDIDSWLSGVLKEYELPEDVECIKELNTGITIPIDRELLRRVVINVVTNAVQALQDENSDGNQLKVRSEANGERLELSFIDTGPGIPEEIMEKVFEPMFSTRSFGIGLGMPIIKNIIEEHHGGIEIKSKVGQGTTVTLWLPIPKLEEK